LRATGTLSVRHGISHNLTIETYGMGHRSKGGSWYAINEGLSRFVAEKNPSIDIRMIPGGGKDNPTCVEEGKSHFGTSIDFVSAAAYRGLSPYVKPHLKLMTIGVGWSSGNADKWTESQR
jgi:hypothetical protein